MSIGYSGDFLLLATHVDLLDRLLANGQSGIEPALLTSLFDLDVDGSGLVLFDLIPISEVLGSVPLLLSGAFWTVRGRGGISVRGTGSQTFLKATWLVATDYESDTVPLVWSARLTYYFLVLLPWMGVGLACFGIVKNYRGWRRQT